MDVLISQSNARLTDAEILAVMRSNSLCVQHVRIPKAAASMSALMRKGLRLTCDSSDGGHGDGCLDMTNGMCQRVERSAWGNGQVCIIDAVAGSNSFKADPNLLNHVEQAAKPKVLVCRGQVYRRMVAAPILPACLAARRRGDVCARVNIAQQIPETTRFLKIFINVFLLPTILIFSLNFTSTGVPNNSSNHCNNSNSNGNGNSSDIKTLYNKCQKGSGWRAG